MSKQAVYCWDTSVFLAWLGDEAGAPLFDIEQVIAELDQKKAVLIVPVVVFAEILDAKNTPEQMAQFKKFSERSNVQTGSTTQAVAEKTSEIRSKALNLKPPVKLKTPDATMIATAIIYGADVFHTLETSQLLQLSGTPVVDGLRISAPKPLQSTPGLFNGSLTLPTDSEPPASQSPPAS